MYVKIPFGLDNLSNKIFFGFLFWVFYIKEQIIFAWGSWFSNGKLKPTWVSKLIICHFCFSFLKFSADNADLVLDNIRNYAQSDRTIVLLHIKNAYSLRLFLAFSVFWLRFLSLHLVADAQLPFFHMENVHVEKEAAR